MNTIEEPALKEPFLISDQNIPLNDDQVIIDDSYNFKAMSLDEVRLDKISTDGSDYPIAINYRAELQKLYQLGLFKKLTQRGLDDKFQQIFSSETNSSFTSSIFWACLALQVPDIIQESSEKSQAIIRLMQQNYFQMFTCLPQPKQLLINILIYGNVYLVNQLYFQIFRKSQKDRKLFNLRFYFDCVQFCILVCNGIIINDFCISQNIERIFTDKFLSYCRDEFERIAQTQRKKEKQKLESQYFMHKRLKFPSIEHIEEGDTLASTLRKCLRETKGMTKAVSMQGIMQQQFCTETPLQRIFNKKLMYGQSRSDRKDQSKKRSLRSNTILSYMSQLPPKAPDNIVEQFHNAGSPSGGSITLRNADNNNAPSVCNTARRCAPGQELGAGFSSSEQLKRFSKLEKQRFNCTKIGPAVQRGLDSEYNYLPMLKPKNVNHEVIVENYQKDNQFRKGYLELIRQFKLSQQSQSDRGSQQLKKQEENILDIYNASLTNMDKTLLNNNAYNQRFLKEMIDVNCLLRGYDKQKLEIQQNEEVRQKIIQVYGLLKTNYNQFSEEQQSSQHRATHEAPPDQAATANEHQPQSSSNQHASMLSSQLMMSQDKLSSHEQKKSESSKANSTKQTQYNDKFLPPQPSRTNTSITNQQLNRKIAPDLTGQELDKNASASPVKAGQDRSTLAAKDRMKSMHQLPPPQNMGEEASPHKLSLRKETKDSIKTERGNLTESTTKCKETEHEQPQSYRSDTKLASFKNVTTSAFEVDNAPDTGNGLFPLAGNQKQKLRIMNKQERLRKLIEYKEMMNQLNRKQQEEERQKQKYIRIMSKVGKSKRSWTLK